MFSNENQISSKIKKWNKKEKINRKKSDARSVRDKNKWLMVKVEKTVKLITNGRLPYTEISQKNDIKITLQDSPIAS